MTLLSTFFTALVTSAVVARPKVVDPKDEEIKSLTGEVDALRAMMRTLHEVIANERDERISMMNEVGRLRMQAEMTAAIYSGLPGMRKPVAQQAQQANVQKEQQVLLADQHLARLRIRIQEGMDFCNCAPGRADLFRTREQQREVPRSRSEVFGSPLLTG